MVLHENFLSPTDVPSSSNPLSLREAATAEAIGQDKRGEFSASAKKDALQIGPMPMFIETRPKKNSRPKRFVFYSDE